VTLAIVLAGFAMFISGMTFMVLLVLLGRKEFQYATKSDLDEVMNRLAIIGRNQSKLYRYLEAIDVHLGANGHQVLGRWVPSEQAQAGD
jgi:hypothetical protein